MAGDSLHPGQLSIRDSALLPRKQSSRNPLNGIRAVLGEPIPTAETLISGSPAFIPRRSVGRHISVPGPSEATRVHPKTEDDPVPRQPTEDSACVMLQQRPPPRTAELAPDALAPSRTLR